MIEEGKYIAAFQRVGTIYDESLILLGEYVDCEDWSCVKGKLVQDNILKKRSSKWVENILRTVKRRFPNESTLLPDVRKISRFVSKAIPKPAKIQALYQYVCQSDPLVDRLVVELVMPLVVQYGSSKLTKQIYGDFMKKLAAEHPEIDSWSPVVYETWQRKFFTFLRHSGVMEKAPSVRLKKMLIRVEPFAFFVYGLVDKGFSGIAIVQSPLWKRYFMDEEDVEHALSSAQEHGWIEYRRLGSIVELTTSFRSLEEWLNGALG